MADVTLTPYLCIDGAAAAIDFYRDAFGATERYRLSNPDGKVVHAEIEIAGQLVMLADEFPAHGNVGPLALGGTPVTMSFQVPDVDAWVERAAGAGAEVLRPASDQFYGERTAKVRDPFGHEWNFQTRIETLTTDEIEARWREMQAKKTR